MPFTPFHFGPGIAIKAAAPARFSLTIFCYAQVITDLESGYFIYFGEPPPVHRFFHTFVGAALVGIFCGLTGRLVRRLVLAVWAELIPPPIADWFGRPRQISWFVAFSSALIGTASHVFLDSLMHRDVTPLAPFSMANPLYHLISVPLLHGLCLALGLIGLLILPFRTSKSDLDE